MNDKNESNAVTFKLFFVLQVQKLLQDSFVNLHMNILF